MSELFILKLFQYFFVLGFIIQLVVSLDNRVDPVTVRKSVGNSVLNTDTNLAPVILVPGDGGSEIQGMFDNVSAGSFLCSTTTKDWVPVWLNLELVTPITLKCLVNYLKLKYDNKTHTTLNNEGVQTRIPGFGSTSSVEWLDASHFYGTSYYYDIAAALVEKGYKRNVTIKGVPYDFRKAGNEMAQLMDDMVKLIEDTYKQNNNSRVVLLGHSMGCSVVGYLLNQQKQTWKDKFIKSFISLAGPWGGSVKTYRVMASGDNLGVFVLSPLTTRPFMQSMPSTAWLMPSSDYWSANETLVTGPKGNYTVKDYQRFFRDIDFDVGYSMYKDNLGYIFNKPPGVEVHCIHGVSVDTPAGFNYSAKQWHDEQPDVITGDGDGTVNLRSLHGCLRWRGHNQGKAVYHVEIPKVEHLAMLKDANTIAAVKKALQL